MAMEARLSLRQSQRVVMTPLLQQAIPLLQLFAGLAIQAQIKALTAQVDLPFPMADHRLGVEDDLIGPEHPVAGVAVRQKVLLAQDSSP